MKKLILLLTVLFSLSLNQVKAVLPDGSDATDFTLTDLDGTTYNLFDLLAQGKTVYIDFSATWCGPCWNYHQTHALEDLYQQYGPNGTNEVMVFWIEGDLNTNLDCIYGLSSCNGTTQGDWTQGVSYPMFNQTSADPDVAGDYQVTYWPTIYTICPDGKVYESGQATTSGQAGWIQSCSFDANLGNVGHVDCYEDQDGFITTEVIGGFGSINYHWSDGSNQQNLMDVYPGTYSCTITEGHGIKRFIDDVQILGPSSELILDLAGTGDNNCFGDNEGYINIAVDGGTPGYTYAWSNGANTANLSGLPGGTYSVTVTDDNNCFKETSATITEPDELLSTLETTDEDCDQANGTVIITTTGGTPGYLYDFGEGTNTNGVFFNVSAGSYELTVTDGLLCTYTESFTIDHIPGPVANAGPVMLIECTDESLILQGDGSTGGDFLVEWSTDDGNIVSGANTLNPVIDAAGFYILEITNTVNNCYAIDQVLILDDPSTPIADAGSAQSIDCDDPMVELDGTSSSTGSAFVYEWTTTDGNIVSGESSLNPVVNLSGTYTLTVSNPNNGCMDVATVVVEGDGDVPVAQVASAPMIDCQVTQLTLDATGSSEGADYTYEWTTSDGNIISGQNTLQIDVDQAGTYTLTVTNTANDCESTAAVTVEADVDVPVVNIADPGLITCTTTDLTVTANVDNNGEGYAYEWSTDGGNILSGTNELIITVDAAGTYSILVTNTINGCTTLESIDVDVDADVPVVSIDVPQVITCTQTSVVLNGVVSSGGGDITYEWTTTDGNIVSASDGNQATVDAAGTYQLLVLNNENECTATTTVIVEEDIQEPVSIFYSSPVGLQVELENLSTSENSNILWSFGDGNTSEDDVDTYTYEEPGRYLLCLTVYNDCGEDQYCQVVNVVTSIKPDVEVGVTTYKFDNILEKGVTNDSPKALSGNITSLVAYPNPVSDVLHISFTLDQEDATEMTITDWQGRSIIKRSIEGHQYNDQLDLSDLSSGLYLLRINTSNGVMMKKLVVQH